MTDAARADTGDGERGTYVYCIIRESLPREFGPIGIGERATRVHTVHHGELAAVVSDAPLAMQEVTREHVLAHELVTETVLRAHTVVPLSFGTVFRSEDDVRALLRAADGALREVLEKVEGRCELGITVRWDRERALERLSQTDEGVRKLREAAARQAHAFSYYARQSLARSMDDALTRAAGALAAEVQEAFRPVSVASRSNRPVGDRMILNGAYLVERSRVPEFDAVVRQLERRLGDVLVISRTGPWPPYNFVNLRLRLERAAS